MLCDSAHWNLLYRRRFGQVNEADVFRQTGQGKDHLYEFCVVIEAQARIIGVVLPMRLATPLSELEFRRKVAEVLHLIRRLVSTVAYLSQ